MEIPFVTNNIYVVLSIILLIICCYLFYLLRKGRRNSFPSNKELIQSKFELKEALRRQELALRSIDFGLVYIDKDFCVQWETTSKIQQLVVNHQFIPGHLCYQTTGLKKEACVDCPFKAAVKAGETVTRLVHVDELDFEISATPVYDTPDELIGGLLRIEDVTEKIKLNNSLREAKDKAEESNRLKTAFLANISHEIRTPLNTIIGFSDMICQVEDEESRMEFNRVIQNNSGILLHLIDNILDLSKIEAGRMEFNYALTDVNELIDETLVQMQQKYSNTNVSIEIEGKVPVCVIKTDGNQLTQVISNLVDNALKFTSQGSVSIGYKMNESTCEFYFYVKDTGIGIPANKKKSIFERFVKLDPFVQGAGLGLSIAQSIVSRLGGEIGVDSEEGKGSCFWFRIPTRFANK